MQKIKDVNGTQRVDVQSTWLGIKINFSIWRKLKGGNFTFEDDISTKIRGKWTIILGNEKTKEHNSLLVENMKHNLLIVIQMCEFKKCELGEKNSSKLVAMATKTPNNVCTLDIEVKEQCCMEQMLIGSLWNKRMGHMSFDYLLKVTKKEVVRDMLKIIKPSNFICKHINMGSKQK